MRKLLHDEIPRISIDEIQTHQRHPISVVVDNVRSIHNVGAFFRTADGAWVDQLILAGITGTPENRALHKTALGSQDTIPWKYVHDSAQAVSTLKENGHTIIALELTDSPTLPDELSLTDFPATLVIGNELDGIRPEILELADYALEIPQYGTKQSLNVSVAFGIALFDLVRQYRKLTSQPLLEDPFPRTAP